MSAMILSSHLAAMMIGQRMGYELCSLLPADYLRPTPSFTLKHVEEEGIEGSVEFQFMATTQKLLPRI
ncbi:DUF4999 domain-containing protein [Bacteroides thetaiotaomicron]|uniref:DUF4999 domain-containing protein n=1 Tax=Bacteroides thetaiotaomicron TaxID=818 RepID=UPI0018DBB034|nr:DUF4999 domain-containing protein [Bacteroides thetaiotaomicron]MBI0303319.1 hypothetical protein [Bacteroides thetaiotaomicron]